MTYNEWRDELKANLLCVSDAERRRVLDYYAEAYADRRDAGFTEREIIEDFGAPYDAAQRILAENREEYGGYPQKEPENKRQRKKRREDSAAKADYYDDGAYEDERRILPQGARQDGGYTFLFVLLCIIFCVPLFGVITGMIGITIGFCTAPFGLLIGGVATIGAGIGALFSDAVNGFITIGTGLVIFGLSLILMPLFFKLVKLMWTLFKNFFKWLKNLLCGRRAY